MATKEKLQGALRSKMMWVGAAVTGLGFVQEKWDLVAPLFTAYPRSAGLAMMILGVLIKVLRWVMTQTLEEKAPEPTTEPATIHSLDTGDKA